MHHTISFLLRIAYAGAFGFILIWHTGDIVRYIPQLLGGLLMLECVAQLLELFYLKAKTRVRNAYLLLPFIITLYGLYLICLCDMRPDEFAACFANSTNEAMADDAFRAAYDASRDGSQFALWELKIGGGCFLAFVVYEIFLSIIFFKPLYMPTRFAEERLRRKEAEAAQKRASEEALTQGLVESDEAND